MIIKCPKCEQTIPSVELVGPTVGNQVIGPLLSGYVAVCPHCRSVLGVVVDPSDTARQVTDAMGALIASQWPHLLAQLRPTIEEVAKAIGNE
jgi:hypothetical protein